MTAFCFSMKYMSSITLSVMSATTMFQFISVLPIWISQHVSHFRNFVCSLQYYSSLQLGSWNNLFKERNVNNRHLSCCIYNSENHFVANMYLSESGDGDNGLDPNCCGDLDLLVINTTRTEVPFLVTVVTPAISHRTP